MVGKRLQTAGTYDFATIIRDGMVYADKTDLVYDLTHEYRLVFLSRPRRFGKSLLCSTLKYYFEGRKELFSGLKIDAMEQDWKEYPVLHFDMSAIKEKTTVEGMAYSLKKQIVRIAENYHTNIDDATPGDMLTDLIVRLSKQSPVVIIIDEYDAPMLNHLNKESLDEVRQMLKEFYLPIKICDAHIRFALLTGITKFSHLSIFSTLNNLKNISMHRHFAGLCGITDEELHTVFAPDVADMAENNHCSVEEMYGRLKMQFDGYHFSEMSPDIYNPYSLTLALDERRIRNYWFESGTPTFLFEEMKRLGTNIMDLSDLELSAEDFDLPTESMDTIIPLLYQSGYLTIKDYEPLSGRYTLGFPNGEVKTGFMDNLMKSYLNIPLTRGSSLAIDMRTCLYKDDIDGALTHMRAFFAKIPYPDAANGLMDDIARFEAYYEVLMWVAFTAFGAVIETEVKSARGRCDLVLHLKDTRYVMELKVGDTAQNALAQINSKGYAIPYQTPDKKIVKIGISFSHETRTIEDWIIEQ